MKLYLNRTLVSNRFIMLKIKLYKEITSIKVYKIFIIVVPSSGTISTSFWSPRKSNHNLAVNWVNYLLEPTWRGHYENMPLIKV